MGEWKGLEMVKPCTHCRVFARRDSGALAECLDVLIEDIEAWECRRPRWLLFGLRCGKLWGRLKPDWHGTPENPGPAFDLATKLYGGLDA